MSLDASLSDTGRLSCLLWITANVLSFQAFRFLARSPRNAGPAPRRTNGRASCFLSITVIGSTAELDFLEAVSGSETGAALLTVTEEKTAFSIICRNPTVRAFCVFPSIRSSSNLTTWTCLKHSSEQRIGRMEGIRSF
ncbi:hypothetical protein AOLI_G00077100 [Acnodon oligacanthus]